MIVRDVLIAAKRFGSQPMTIEELAHAAGYEVKQVQNAANRLVHEGLLRRPMRGVFLNADVNTLDLGSVVPFPLPPAPEPKHRVQFWLGETLYDRLVSEARHDDVSVASFVRSVMEVFLTETAVVDTSGTPV